MAYSFYRTITIDHTKVGSSDHTNFPVLVTGTYTWLKTVGNGGDVQSGSGYDIVFTASDGTTMLDFERVTWTAASGLCEFWVRVPTVSHTSDTVIRIYYGDASVTTDQQNRNGTWNSNYKCVLHLNSVSDLTDSTSNGNNASNTGLTTISGPWNGAVDNDGTGTNNLSITNGLYEMISGAAVHTVSLWWNCDNRAPHAMVVWEGDTAHNFTGWELGQSSDFYWGIGQSGANALYTGPSRLNGSGVQPVLDDTWHYLAMVKTAAGNNGRLHLNPGSFASAGGGGTSEYGGGYASGSLADPQSGGGTMLTKYHGTTTDTFNGAIKEFRVLDVALSSDRVLAEYNNQVSPSTFYSVGSPTVPSSGNVPVILHHLRQQGIS